MRSRTFLHSLRNSVYSNGVGDSFLKSETFRIINPYAHQSSTNTVTQEIPASKLSSLSDEQIVARFTSGFFGGRVFGLERFFLRLGVWKLLPAQFSGFLDDQNAIDVLDKKTISTSTLLPIGSRLFGSFKLLDSCVAKNHAGLRTSHVDYAYGSDKARFAGCHRFQVTRVEPSGDHDGNINSEPIVRLSLQCFTCNPLSDKPSAPWFMEYFHRVYAKLLFADGIAKVLKW